MLSAVWEWLPWATPSTGTGWRVSATLTRCVPERPTSRSSTRTGRPPLSSQGREVQQFSTATPLTSTVLPCLSAPRSVLRHAWSTAMPRVRNDGVRGRLILTKDPRCFPGRWPGQRGRAHGRLLRCLQNLLLHRGLLRLGTPSRSATLGGWGGRRRRPTLGQQAAAACRNSPRYFGMVLARLTATEAHVGQQTATWPRLSGCSGHQDSRSPVRHTRPCPRTPDMVRKSVRGQGRVLTS